MMNFLMIAFLVLLFIALLGNRNEHRDENSNTAQRDANKTMHPAEMPLR